MGQESQTSCLSHFLDIRQQIKGCRGPFLARPEILQWLQRRHAGQAEHTVLRRRVGRHPLAADQAGDRGEVDDAAAARRGPCRLSA